MCSILLLRRALLLVLLPPIGVCLDLVRLQRHCRRSVLSPLLLLLLRLVPAVGVRVLALAGGAHRRASEWSGVRRAGSERVETERRRLCPSGSPGLTRLHTAGGGEIQTLRVVGSNSTQRKAYDRRVPECS